MISTAYRVLLALTMVLTLSGCGLIDYYFIKPPEDTARELYEAGQTAMQEKDYGTASEYFQKLVDRYPFSPMTPSAELGLGDAKFAQKNYKQAIDSYKEFESLHPRNKEIPYVLLRIGLSYYNEFESIDRPQDNAGEALQYFIRLRDTYPGTKEAAEAVTYVATCRRHLAEHEVYVADFYWRESNFQAAWKRYQHVVDNFTDLPDIVEYARGQAHFSYYNYQQDLSEQERENVQGSWKKWFRWL